MCKIITLYNHKGGVSKTTTTFNLAHYLAQTGKKVLAVDADPQTNLTEIMLATLIDELDSKQIEAGNAIENDIEGTSLLEILKPRIDGDVRIIETSSVKTIKITDNLELLRGDVDLSTIEDSLAEAHSQRFSAKVHEKRTYVAISDILTRYAEENKIDYVIIDVGPSSGALTRACFLACDAYFVPTAPDRFNVQAISTLSKIIEKWITEHQQIYNDFREIELPIKIGKPKFLGVILQNFKVTGGNPKPTYRMWMERIPKKVESDLFPVLRKFNDVDLDLTSGLHGESVVVSKIRDLQGLSPIMQECGKAIFDITQEDTKSTSDNNIAWTGVTWDQAVERMNAYKLCISQLAQNLELI